MKIAVIGLGDSLKEFNPLEYNLSIGINDIWRVVKTDIVVCLDPEKNFTADRLKVIQDCKPQIFYSQIVNWDTRSDFKKIDILPGYPDNYCNLDASMFQKSFCSPFVAVQIAWKYHGATEIHLFGVDLVNHAHLDVHICRQIKTHFRHLKTALEFKKCNLIIHGEGILKDI